MFSPLTYILVVCFYARYRVLVALRWRLQLREYAARCPRMDSVRDYLWSSGPSISPAFVRSRSRPPAAISGARVIGKHRDGAPRYIAHQTDPGHMSLTRFIVASTGTGSWSCRRPSVLAAVSKWRCRRPPECHVLLEDYPLVGPIDLCMMVPPSSDSRCAPAAAISTRCDIHSWHDRVWRPRPSASHRAS